MGGLGSGRRRGSGKINVEECRSIDVNQLHKAGCLHGGWAGSLQWMRDGETLASINLRAEHDRLHLTFRVCMGGETWQDVIETVRIACHRGGARPYFVCPGVVTGDACGRRVAKLHAAGPNFLCRHCSRLAYASQSKDWVDRMLRRAGRIRQRLGGDPGMVSRFPDRPKGIWRRTSERLRLQALEAELTAAEVIDVRVEQLLDRIERPARCSAN